MADSICEYAYDQTNKLYSLQQKVNWKYIKKIEYFMNYVLPKYDYVLK